MYTVKKSTEGQTCVIRTADADKPHCELRWYAGGIWSRTVVAMADGESPAECAARVNPAPTRYRDTLTARELHWVD